MRGRRVFAHAAQQRVHARGELGGRKRLCHIVVRAGHQTRHLVHLLRARRQHDDADLRVRHADAAADFQTVDVRQHDVEQAQLRVGIFLQFLKRLLAALSLHDLVARTLQIDDNKTTDTGFILQHQHFFHIVSPLSCLPSSIPP